MAPTAGESAKNKRVVTSPRRDEASTTGKPIAANNPNVLIAVMGATGSGKSRFINVATNSWLRIREGLQSSTSVVQLGQPFELNGRRVTLIDTPGFNDTTRSDVDTLRMIAEYLAFLYKIGKNLAGVIYVHRIADFMMDGIYTRNIKMFRKLCGESVLKNVVIVTNMWSEVSEDFGSAREAELASDDATLRPVLEKGAQLLRHTNTRASAQAIIARIMDNHPLPLQIQQELVDDKLAIGQTAAGQELKRKLELPAQKNKQEMDKLRLEKAICDKDGETERELEAVVRKLQAKLIPDSPRAGVAKKPLRPAAADITIAVMGATGSGKTTFINLASNSHLLIGSGLKSCTSIVQAAQPFELNGRRVTLIDTPGFDDTTRSDADILGMIAEFLVTAYENGRKLAGVIYVHRISDFRMGGISTRNFKMFRKLCGESALKNIIVVTNMWSEVFEDIGSARETELASEDMFFKPVLDKDALILRHSNTLASAYAIIARIIDNHPLPLQIQQELIHGSMDIGQTAAGQELNKELEIMEQKHKEEMDELRKEMQQAIRDKDEATRRKLEIVKGKLEARIARLEKDRERLVLEFAAERKQLAKESEAARQREHDEHITLLRTQFERSASTQAAATERADLLNQISELQRQFAISQGFFTQLGRSVDRIFK